MIIWTDRAESEQPVRNAVVVVVAVAVAVVVLESNRIS